MGSLEGKAALVLGAATEGNVGQAIAARFASEGAAVMVAGRDDRGLAQFVARAGGEFCTCDIRDEDQLARLVDETVKRFGKLDVAANATGVNLVKPFLETDRVDLDRVIDVQFVGTYQFLQAVLRRISDRGSIMQISSLSAYSHLPDHAAYMASKAAGDVLVKSLAIEFGHRGLRINSIAPGPIEDTPMARVALSDEITKSRIEAATPLGRLGRAADIAEAALWLAADQCFVTGEVLHVSGGRAIPRLR